MTKLRSLRYEGNTAFSHTLWDRYDLLGTLALSRSLDERDRHQREQYEYSYVQDGFYALLDRPTVYVPGGDEFVEKWEWITSTPQFRTIQTIFERDDVGRIVATEQLAILMEKLTKPDDEEEQEEGQSDNTQQEQGDADGEEENNSDGQEETDEQQEKAEDEGQGQDDSDQEQTEGNNEQETENESQEESQPSGQTPGQTCAERSECIGPKQQSMQTPSLTELKETAQDVEDTTNALHGLLPYVGDEVFPEQIRRAQLLVDRFDVRELAKYLGFAKRAVKGAHRMSDASTGEFTGYKNTEWSDRLHPVDLIGVATKSLTTLVRISEGTLRERTFIENRARGRGPVILLRDESGSMEGTEHIKAQELELALANAFNSDKRDLVSIAWDNIRTRIHTYGEGDAADHLSRFLGGGTVLGHALDKALEVADEYVNGADILILTDGMVMQESHEERLSKYRKHGGRVWVILLGHSSSAVQWADAVITLDDIETSDKLSDIISQMNTKRAEAGEKRRVF